MKKLITIITVLVLTMILMIGCKPKEKPVEIIEGFKPIKESFKDYKFKVSEDKDAFTIKGKFDLNNDGKKDEINLRLQKEPKTLEGTYIEINGIKREIYIDAPNGEVKLLDLDKNDEFIEIAFFDNGPSDDPQYHIYRYDGKGLYEVGNVDDKALLNGNGKALPSVYVSDFQPAFYSSWLEIKDNKFVLKNKSIDEYLGKNYVLDRRKDVFFVPMKEMPKEFNPPWDNAREFQTTELTLLDVYFPYGNEKILNFYFIELPNGEKGMMYFWIGD